MTTPTTGYSTAAKTTYNALRIGMIALPLFLGLAVLWLQAERGPLWTWHSISAHYYSPIRDIFVGALVAMGVILIAIKGREPLEDPLLNVAGMFAPVVALVPTPWNITPATACPEGWAECHPDLLRPQLDLNFRVVLVVGAVALVVIGLVTRVWKRRPAKDPPASAWQQWQSLIIWIIGLLLYAGVALFFVLGRDEARGFAFFLHAHDLAAGGLFGLVGAIAFAEGISAVRHPNADEHKALPAWAYRLRVASYFAVTLAIAATIIAWIAGFSFFWVEMLLMGLFALFWVLQTFQYWQSGGPESVSGDGS